MAKRHFVSFTFSDLSEIKQQVLNWSARFDTFSFLDNQQYPSSEDAYECLLAAGSRTELQASAGQAFNRLKQFSLVQDDWLFGHFSFDLKAETEESFSTLPDPVGFPDMFFFVPEIILLVHKKHIEIGMFENRHAETWNEILLSSSPPEIVSRDIIVKNRVSKEEYLQIIGRLQSHILRGDCYEINFCQEFYIENTEIQPFFLYKALSETSPSPFSAFYRIRDKYLLCASPERYLKKSGNMILSQPIKGTAARDRQNEIRDAELKSQLAASEKDRAENVMVVDLVRNDLSKICETDSVKVTELFGIYSFAQVHQMISTIVGKPVAGLYWSEMIKKTFPMGSMTGAPKKRVLQLIEQYEKTKRGLFSGALGYVTPCRDFDFNVVIRSLFYNGQDQYLSYLAGSGITANSDPEKEYEECLAKVSSFENIIKNPLRKRRNGL